MPLVKDHLSDVVGLRNAIVDKVFSCPDCKSDVTISKYQVAGDFSIMCGRCNTRWQIKGENLINMNKERFFMLERHNGVKSVEQPMGYKVYQGIDATQKAAPIPKDSFVLVMKPELAPKPAPGVPKPAAAPAAPAAEGGPTPA